MKREALIAMTLVVGVLALGSLGAFFLYVSPLTIGYVASIVSGMFVMFALGIQVAGRGSHEPQPEETAHINSMAASVYPGAPRADRAYRSHALLRS
jgi:hypothetical protein